jgi:N-acetylmuramoyl-L-alanine amidase
MIQAIFQRIRQDLHEQYLAAVNEAKKAEDADVMNVPPLVETLPICEDEKQLIEWIQNQVITRKIKGIAIHCTATRTTATANAIQNYWKNNLGWKNPGYHILFHHSGGFTVMADLDRVCNGVGGFNSELVHLSYIGGVDANNNPIDNRSDVQKRLMLVAVKSLKKRLPAAYIQGHRDFPRVRKACPCFDAKKEFSEI